MDQETIDEMYMRRCIQLAKNGMQNAKPNPMVGAVIVSKDGQIIGEGYHAKCGEGHAEVNAFASVRPEDESLLPNATIYVSLEPCSHYGKTPPCADLIVHKGVHRVVCGCIDPFSKVQGRGVKKIRDAGIEVTVGVLERECKEVNKRFITFNTEHRPYIILKWAQTANGFMGIRNESGEAQQLFVSTSYTKMLVHQTRAENDAILIGRGTLDCDHPQLNVREWSGPSPERILLSHSNQNVPDGFVQFADIPSVLNHLYEENKQSLLVEGGAKTLRSFLENNYWDEIRVETTTKTIAEGIKVPQVPVCVNTMDQQFIDGNTITIYERQ